MASGSEQYTYINAARGSKTKASKRWILQRVMLKKKLHSKLDINES